MISANDGVVAGAGIIQGLLVAEYAEAVALTAGFSALFAGAFAAGGAAYSEFATEHDADRAEETEEDRLAALDPETFRAELEQKEIKRGLSPSLARQVAYELMMLDGRPEVGHGEDPEDQPVTAAVLTAVAFALGALIPLLAVMAAPSTLDEVVLISSATLAVAVSSTIAARSAKISTWKTVLRTLTIAAMALVVSSLVGLVGHA